MRIDFKAHTFLLWAVIAALAAASSGSAQTKATIAGTNTRDMPRPELALQYNFVRSNAPQGGCGCFHLNGGSATIAWPETDGHLAIVGDVTVTHGGSILGTNQDLLLTVVTAGLRYKPAFTYRHVQVYGQALIGLAHAGGFITRSTTQAATSAGTVFAANVGGGADLALSRRFAIRLVEANYLVTTFYNGGNNHQNILRLGSGVVLRW
jgi:peptidoglycan-associated lipoprotein